jgi:hypothetical protein
MSIKLLRAVQTTHGVRSVVVLRAEKGKRKQSITFILN